MFDPMKTWVLGYCLSCPDGEGRHGKIQVLATLKKNVDGKYVADQSGKDDLEEIFGPGGKVFWPLWLAVPENLKDCIVRFRCEQGREYGTSDLSRDWMIVSQDRNSLGQVKRFEGYRLVDHNADVQWRSEPRWIRSEVPGDRLFLRNRLGTRLVGPWRVGDEIRDRPGYRDLNPDLIPPKVYKFPITSFPPDCWFHHHAPTQGGESVFAYLMYHPDPSLGEVVDLATSKQLADWLVDRVVEGVPRLVERLDAEEPGWRKGIRKELESRVGEDRQISSMRWNNFESILEHLQRDAEQVSRVLEHPRYKAIIEEGLTAEVEALKEARLPKIEAEARASAEAAIDGHAERIEEARRLADEEVARFNAQSAEAKARLEDLEAKLRERKNEWVERQRAYADLAAHLDESRGRLARDIAVYQSLSMNGHAPASAVTTRTKPTARPVRLEGEPIRSQADFVSERLGPLIAEKLHVHEHAPAVAWMLHATASCARATLIPSPAWARAYADALGGTGRLTFVNVQPTWLGFEDLWNGGLGPCWKRAADDPSAIELVLLRDFNRALPQCYARPLLDLIAGYADELPAPGRGAWPDRLRVLACPAAPEDSIPLTVEVARHFAGIRRELSLEAGDAPAPTPGHVPADCWANWNGAPSDATKFQHSLIGDFGPLAAPAARDLAAIAQRLRTARMIEREARVLATEVRVEFPLEYVNGLANPPKGAS